MQPYLFHTLTENHSKFFIIDGAEVIELMASGISKERHKR